MGCPGSIIVQIDAPPSLFSVAIEAAFDDLPSEEEIGFSHARIIPHDADLAFVVWRSEKKSVIYVMCATREGIYKMFLTHNVNNKSQGSKVLS